MTKLKSGLGAILAVAALWGAGLAGFTGCPLDSSSADAGYGRVTIDLGDAVESVNRTVFPGKSGLTYTYTFTKDGGSPQTLTPSGGSFTLEYGDWSVAVNAYAGADQSSGNLAATGTQDFTVDAASQTVAIELTGVADTGSGTFKYKIQYPADASITSFTMQKMPNLYPSVTLTPSPVTSGGMLEISETVNSVSAGFYLVTITIDKVGGSSGRNELVHIYNNLTTEFGTDTAPIVLTADNFTAIPLTEDVWAEGNLPADGTQWFSFAATAATQIYYDFPGSSDNYNIILPSGRLQVYDNAGNPVGTEQSINGTNQLSSAITTPGQYYVKIRPSQNYYSGKYWIAISSSGVRPPVTPPSGVIPLTENVWTDGNLDAGGMQWFSFTASADPQYIHAYLTDMSTILNVQLYDNTGALVGNSASLSNQYPLLSFSRSVTAGTMYYIRVVGNANMAYQIGFNSSATPPPVLLPTTGVPILTENIWTDGMFADGAYDEIKWFKFTASASSLFIHSKSDYYISSYGNVYIQVYDSNGIAVGGINDQFNPIGVAVTSGNDYYIKTYTTYSRLSGYGDITHEITFSTNVVPPGVTPTPLAPDVWTNGDFPSWLQTHWYSFTATNATQYIHFSLGTVYAGYAKLYDNTSTEIDVAWRFHAGNLYVSRSVTPGQIYYLSVLADYSPGTYRIAFNDSAAAPSP